MIKIQISFLNYLRILNPLRFLISIVLIFFTLSQFDSVAMASGIEAPQSRWVDRSHSIFLPPQLSEKLGAQQKFPIFWWNFLVIEFGESVDLSEAEGQKLGIERAGKICQSIVSLSPDLVRKTGCLQDLNQFKPLIQDWARDESLRQEAPPFKRFRERLDASLAKASLPMGRSLLEILRVDPMESYKGLLGKVEKEAHIRLERVQGYFFDATTKRILIPVQMSFSPSMTQKYIQFRESLNQICEKEKFCDRIFILGPHASTLENEEQVNQDVKVVSRIGTSLLILLGIGAVLTKRWKLLLIVPPVLFSTFVSAVLTILIFGSIHGLTLSFGTGIIGLAMDYSLHSVFNQKYEGIWKANLYGLLTTIVALILMMFTSIPLLRQIMVFSTLGLVLGYSLYYYLDQAFPRVFDVKPLNYSPETSKSKFGLILSFLVLSVVGLLSLKLNLDIRLFNYQSPRTAELSVWLYQHLDMKAPLLQNYSSGPEISPLTLAHEQKTWAIKNQIHWEGVAHYIPDLEAQKKNQESWFKLFCSPEIKKLPSVYLDFFQPYFKARNCDLSQVSLMDLRSTEVPAYLRDFWNDGHWLTLWFPKSDQETKLIKDRYPDSLSIKEVVSIFPETLAKELRWMAPLSLVLATLLLAFYYRKLYPTFLGMIPFFSGLGLFALGTFLFHFQVTFITIIALVMVFGCSIDYGVFAVDLAIGKKRSVTGVWSALSLSALVTVIGFIPLIFCKHPVLSSLGQPLVLGTIGTYLGTVWGISGCVRFFKKFEVRG